MKSINNPPNLSRIYDRSECIIFYKTTEIFGGLSNMASGFPININKIKINTIEALYQACRYPHIPEIQKQIIGKNSPIEAKRCSQLHKDKSRKDWNKIRVPIMRWCLRVKLIQNWEKFSTLLLATENKPIVEQSKNDIFWGAKKQGDQQLIGQNILGRLLMELRDKLKEEFSNSEIELPTPDISNFLLLNKPIEKLLININDNKTNQINLSL